MNKLLALTLLALVLVAVAGQLIMVLGSNPASLAKPTWWATVSIRNHPRANLN